MEQFEVNEKLIKALKEEGFSSDLMLTQYFILRCLYFNHRSLLFLVDDSDKSKRLIIQYYELMRKGLVVESEDSNKFAFVLTDKGKKLVENIECLNKPKATSADEWIDQWLDLFPKGVKSGGKLLRSDKKSCLTKMNKFLKEYSFSQDEIMDATKAYLDEREKDDWKYCKCATYFISKLGEGSSLAEWCETTKDEPKEEFTFINNGGLI